MRQVTCLFLVGCLVAPTPGRAETADGCILPASGSEVPVSYHIWYVGGQFASGAGREPFCDTVGTVESNLAATGLHFRFTPGSPYLCDDLPHTVIANGGQVSDINKFSRNLLKPSMTWEKLHAFVQEGMSNGNQHFLEDRVNVYVVEPSVVDEDFRGVHLRDIKSADYKGNLIFVPSDVSPGTLAHEFGHAFSLNHVNFWAYKGALSEIPVTGTGKPEEHVEFCSEYDYWDGRCDYSRDNFMWAGGGGRSQLSAGQAARAVCNDWSAVNVNGDRAGQTFNCPDWAVTDVEKAKAGTYEACPPLP